MTCIIIISGFLGSGKTTYINKLLPLLKGKKAVLENEFGEVGIDGYLINEEIPVKEIVRGCICCSLISEFKKGLISVINDISPEWVIIEPSGVSSLSSIQNAVKEVLDDLEVFSITLAEAPMYMDFHESFGAFYEDQIKYGDSVVLTKIEAIEEETGNLLEEELKRILLSIKSINPGAPIITEDIRKMDDEDFLKTIPFLNENFKSQNQIEKSKLLSTNNSTPNFSSMALRNLKFYCRKDLEELLLKLKTGKLEKIYRIKGTVYVEGKKVFINSTLSSDEIIELTEKANAYSKGTVLVIIGIELQKEMISKLFKSSKIWVSQFDASNYEEKKKIGRRIKWKK